MKKVALVFPGVGYHCDKPLLYYAKKLAASYDFEIIEVSYKNIPAGLLKSEKLLFQAEDMVFDQARDFFSDFDFSPFSHILFISKSIGTYAAVKVCEAFLKESASQKSAHILYTPLERTFSCNFQKAHVFAAGSDPWIKGNLVESFCKERNLPLDLYQNANHSLEGGNVLEDLNVLHDVMQKTAAFMQSFALQGFV